MQETKEFIMDAIPVLLIALAVVEFFAVAYTFWH